MGEADCVCDGRSRCRRKNCKDRCPTIQPIRTCTIPENPVIPSGQEEPETEVSLWFWWFMIALVVVVMIALIVWSIRKKRMANGIQKWGWMAIIVLFILALMMPVFGLFYDEGEVVISNPIVIDDENPIPDMYTVEYPDNAGSSSACGNGDVFYDFNGQSYVDGPSCNLNVTSRWNNDGCECIPPFYGNCCSREAYSDRYFEAGTIGDNCQDGVRYKVLKKTRADRLSFPFEGIDCDQRTCTDQCDREKHCTGVLWDGAKKCTLITGNVYLDSSDDITWDKNCDSNLFLKNDSSCSRRRLSGRDVGYTRHLKIPNMVWVWRECLPLRYYLSDVSMNNGRCAVTPLEVNVPKRLDIIPEGSANQGRLFGVFTTYRVNEFQARELLDKRRCPKRCPEKCDSDSGNSDGNSSECPKPPKPPCKVWFDKPGKPFPKIPVVEELWSIYIKRV